ncbi:LPD29 domain-containing protein [Nocardia brasiliensis]|uniref:LPD29 domain-containing protein n=1 Tax=Nocardia brasiliensis TaxID=37326 RepID=UPI002456FD70|nr:hypothetical protein [Nocardia brasiliensis]
MSHTYRIIETFTPPGGHPQLVGAISGAQSPADVVGRLHTMADVARADAEVSQITRYWDSLYVYRAGGLIEYEVEPLDASGRCAAIDLMSAALGDAWPDAAFSVAPWDKEVLVHWIDGPTEDTVRDYLRYLYGREFHIKPKRLQLRRLYSDPAWKTIASAITTSIGLEVPRTATGEVDWRAAAEVTVFEAPESLTSATTRTRLDLDELLRVVAHSTAIDTAEPDRRRPLLGERDTPPSAPIPKESPHA